MLNTIWIQSTIAPWPAVAIQIVVVQIIEEARP